MQRLVLFLVGFCCRIVATFRFAAYWCFGIYNAPDLEVKLIAFPAQRVIISPSTNKVPLQVVDDIGGCECGDRSLAGADEAATTPPPNTEWRIDSLPYFSHLCLGLEGKWLKMFNQPTRGFSAMIYGKPKTAKSTLMLEFASYLARNFGSVLWVELEEKLFTTFKEKIDRLNVGHPDFIARQELSENLSRFDFVFIKSVSETKMSPDEIRELKKKWRE